MRIGVVGGLDRSAPHLEAIAREAGHVLEHHHGRTGGNGSRAIERLVERSDIVLILMDVNSHGAVAVAKRAARDAGRRSVVMRQCGVSRLAEVIRTLALAEVA
jgi:hypothetical protein